MAGLPEPIVCSEFWLNRGGERPASSSCANTKGRCSSSIFACTIIAPDGTLLPTHKGLSPSIRKLPELTVAVGKALKRARELGLFEDKS